MRGVANTKQPRLMPKRQPVDGDGEQINVVKAFEFGGAARQKWRKLFDTLPERRDAPRLELRGRAFGNDIAALPIGAAIDEDENVAAVGPAKRLVRITFLP